MKKILVSLSMIAVVGAVVVGGTIAYFSDTETSTGNTFTAGSIDLKVDSTAHFNRMICTLIGTNYTWQPEVGFTPDSSHYPQPGTPCEGTWALTDLKDGVHKFFNFTDLKPGDEGEDTLSLHVYSNDAWGKMTITGVTDTGNTCTEPETKVEADLDCWGKDPGTAEPNGELRKNTKFSFWLDQGTIPGFQGKTIDPQEGDNVWQKASEPLLSGVIPFGYTAEGAWIIKQSDGIIEITPEVHNLWVALAAVRAGTSACVGLPADGHNSNGPCHGLAVDGRLVGNATYYFGMAWQIPYTVGNEAQSDGFKGDLKFEVVQHRNNPSQTF